MEEYKDVPIKSRQNISPSAACPERHAPCPHPRADEHYRENRRHGIHRQRPFPKRRAGFACNTYEYFSAWHTGIWTLWWWEFGWWRRGITGSGRITTLKRWSLMADVVHCTYTSQYRVCCRKGELYEKTAGRIYGIILKVKEVKKAKGLAGEHLGAPPYGYLRNPDDKTRWHILRTPILPSLTRTFPGLFFFLSYMG